MREENNNPVVLAFIYPQEGIDYKTSGVTPNHIPYLTSVDIIEALTGFDFLSTLDDEKEATIEKTIAVELWPTE